MDAKDRTISELKGRLNHLAKEKAKSQLLREVLKSFRTAATFEDNLKAIVQNTLMFHGGMEVHLYYTLGSRWFLYDQVGNRGEVDIAGNTMLQQVLRERTYVEEIEEPPQDLKEAHTEDMQRVTGLCTSCMPLIVAGSIIAILKLNGRMIYDFEFQEEFDDFFTYSGVALQNAILNRNALSDMESEYRQIFESNNDGMMVLDQSHQIRRVNLMMTRLLGISREELQGRSILDFDEIDESAKLWLESGQSDTTFEQDTTFTNRTTRSRQYCILSISVLTDSINESVGHILSLKDIGERVRAEEELRLSEERFSLAMRGSNDGLWDWNLKTGESFISSRWKEVFGYHEDELHDGIGDWNRLLEENSKRMMQESLESLLVGRSDRFEAELRMRHKDGSFVDVLSRAFLLKDQNGEGIRLIGTLTDLTEIKSKERELQVAKEKAEESERVKSAFLANMSHEVRTPMNGIIGFSKMLMDMDLTREERREYAGIVLESSRRLLKIVNDILDISQIESGAMVLEAIDINLNRLMDNLYAFFTPQAEAQSLVLKVFKTLEDSQAKIHADPIRLEQVLSNLISNAMKFTEHGSIDFGYRLSGDRLIFHVRDTGPGIPEADQSRIFQRFQQSDRGQGRRFGGNGLGLSISNEIVKMMGGEIRLSSAVGEGSTFSFAIPYTPVPVSRHHFLNTL